MKKQDPKSFQYYFLHTLNFLPIQQKNALQAFTFGIADMFNHGKTMLSYTLHQYIPALADLEKKNRLTTIALGRNVYRIPLEKDEEYQKRVIQAYFFHINKGTKEGMQNILALYGYPNMEIEEKSPPRWAEFMLNVDNMCFLPSFEDVQKLHILVNDFKPARSRLVRIFNTLGDIRNLIWTNQAMYSKYYWSHISGFPVENEDGSHTLVSLGKKHKTLISGKETQKTHALMESILPQHVRRIPYFMWSFSPYSNHIFPRHNSSISLFLCLTFINSTKDWAIKPKTISRQMLVYSYTDLNKQGNYSSLNARYGKSVYFVHNSPKWSNLVYSNGISKICKQKLFHEKIVTHEKKLALQSYSLHTNLKPLFLESKEYCLSTLIKCLETLKWTGTWDSRHWDSSSVLSHFT